ncbi:hypothetical protein [Streptomyces lydicus]|uniref:hypothetical protein n=1 Tax=Streptomyces lydicus TaxID=47763 RepID=UPI001012DAD5|nr:hypothetical protein [Streptomyces lydicus]MCZ1012070.1 hypothetical protein [Streptomyces lydicus]
MNTTWHATGTPPAGLAPTAPAPLAQVLVPARAGNLAGPATNLPADHPHQAPSLMTLHRLAEATEVMELDGPYTHSERQSARIMGDLA